MTIKATQIKVIQKASLYYLGTQNGRDYSIYPDESK